MRSTRKPPGATGSAQSANNRPGSTVLSPEVLAELFDEAPIGVIAIDGRGRVSYMNRRQLEQSKLNAEQYLGKPYRESFYDTLARSNLLEHFDRLVRDGSPYELTLPRYRRHADDQLISFSARGWRAGDSILILNSVDRELARQLGRYEQLFENASDGIFILDRAGRFVAVNESFAQMTGKAREEILGQTTEIFLPGRFPQSIARLERILSEGRLGPYQLDVETPRGRRSLSLNGFALVDEGDAIGVMNIARDVTETVQMTAKLREARDHALLASRLKTAFLANMSHEIRTPLNVILGFADLLEDKFMRHADAESRSQFESIRRNGNRLLQTIGGILDIARIESGAFDLEPKLVDLADFVAKTLADFGPLACAKNLALSTRVDVSPAIVRFDEYCLVQTITNLLGNAVKFTDNGEISVDLTRVAEGTLKLSVRDTGVGIDEAFLPRVFEPFSQELFESTRPYEGSGLGLPLAKRYVEMNGARLSVESTKGAGTTVTIEFPPEIQSDRSG